MSESFGCSRYAAGRDSMTSQSPLSQGQLAFPWQDSERLIEERVELLRRALCRLSA
jgi:hypothetical protein